MKNPRNHTGEITFLDPEGWEVSEAGIEPGNFGMCSLYHSWILPHYFYFKAIILQLIIIFQKNLKIILKNFEKGSVSDLGHFL